MGTLVYRGAPLATDADVSYRDYTTSKKTADLTTTQVDALINSGLSGYADQSYVDAQDAKNATRAYIDAQDNLRLKLANIGLPNGIAGLDASGRISPSFINAPLTQRYFRGPWSPPSYFSSAVDLTTETTLFAVNITDPGYPYQLMVFGEVDSRSNLDGEYAVINVRAGSPTGEIVAQGLGSAGANESAVPGLGDDFNASGGWEVASLDGGGGGYGLNGAGALVWNDSGGADHYERWRRTNPADMTTATDWQKIEMGFAGAGEDGSGGGNQSISIYGRINTSFTDYISLNTDGQYLASLGYATAGTFSQMQNGVNGFVVSPAGSVGVNQGSGQRLGLVCGHTGGLRSFAVTLGGQVIQTALDTVGVTSMGPTFRGWGFLGHAASRFFGATQTTPPSLDYVKAADAGPNSKMVSIIPAANPSMVVRSGSITLYVRAVRSGSSSSIHAAPVHPAIYPIAFPAG